MKTLIGVLLTLALFACGKAEDGRDGRDGETPTPIPGEDGVGIPGQPGSDSIVDKRVCKLSWPLTGEPAGRSYEASYNVIFYKEKLKLASLIVTYKTAAGSLLDESKSLLIDDSVDPRASVDMGLWTGSLSADLSSFDLLRKPTKEVRSVKCL